MKVISCRITKTPKKILENGDEVFLFDFYPDEISFEPNEFIGLTIEECKKLKTQKDMFYILYG